MRLSTLRNIAASVLMAVAVPMSASVSTPSDRIVIVDGDDGGALPAASVFNSAGTMLGISEDDGSFSRLVPSDYPLTVRYLGYYAASVTAPVDTVRMRPQVLSLSEVEVTKHIDGVRVLCYAREFSSAIASDTMSLYTEYMVDYVLPLKKAKGFKSRNTPRILLRRSVGRVAGRNGKDSVWRDMSNSVISWLDMTEISKNGLSEPESLRGRKYGCDSLVTHKISTVYRKTPSRLSFTRDFLSDKKDHSWSPWFLKLLGFTMDVETMWESAVYPVKESGEYQSFDFSSWSYAIGACGRGKWFKKAFKTDKPVGISIFIEIYPVERELISVEESKKLKKGDPEVEWEIPATVPPLDPAIKKLVDRCNAKAAGNNHS